MKNFQPIQFDLSKCESQLSEFRQLLDSKEELTEAKDILPFFRSREQLAAFIGRRFPGLTQPNCFAFEYDLFGDFVCDLVIGNKQSSTWCFVEFEDAAVESIFKKVTNRATPGWSSRFDQGFDQIVDWFWKTSEMRSTAEFRDRFGTEECRMYGLLIVGRNKWINERERRRFIWRANRVLVDSHHVECVTFDDLYKDMEQHLVEIPSMAR